MTTSHEPLEYPIWRQRTPTTHQDPFRFLSAESIGLHINSSSTQPTIESGEDSSFKPMPLASTVIPKQSHRIRGSYIPTSHIFRLQPGLAKERDPFLHRYTHKTTALKMADHLSNRYPDMYIPTDCLVPTLTETIRLSYRERKHPSYEGNTLATERIRGDPLNRSYLAWRSGSTNSEICLEFVPEDGILPFNPPSKASFSTVIDQIYPIHSFNENWLSARSLSSLSFFTIHTADVDTPDTPNCLSIKPIQELFFDNPLVDVSSSTSLNCHAAVLTTKGEIYIWDAKVDSPILWRPRTLVSGEDNLSDDKNKWIGCTFGSHPRTLLAASTISVTCMDLRVPWSTPSSLTNNSSIHYTSPSSKSLITSVDRHPTRPFDVFVSTQTGLMLYDTRYTKTALFTWNSHAIHETHIRGMFPSSEFQSRDKSLLVSVGRNQGEVFLHEYAHSSTSPPSSYNFRPLASTFSHPTLQNSHYQSTLYDCSLSPLLRNPANRTYEETLIPTYGPVPGLAFVPGSLSRAADSQRPESCFVYQQTWDGRMFMQTLKSQELIESRAQQNKGLDTELQPIQKLEFLDDTIPLDFEELVAEVSSVSRTPAVEFGVRIIGRETQITELETTHAEEELSQFPEKLRTKALINISPVLKYLEENRDLALCGTDVNLNMDSLIQRLSPYFIFSLREASFRALDPNNLPSLSNSSTCLTAIFQDKTLRLESLVQNEELIIVQLDMEFSLHNFPLSVTQESLFQHFKPRLIDNRVPLKQQGQSETHARLSHSEEILSHIINDILSSRRLVLPFRSRLEYGNTNLRETSSHEEIPPLYVVPTSEMVEKAAGSMSLPMGMTLSQTQPSMARRGSTSSIKSFHSVSYSGSRDNNANELPRVMKSIYQSRMDFETGSRTSESDMDSISYSSQKFQDIVNGAGSEAESIASFHRPRFRDDRMKMTLRTPLLPSKNIPVTGAAVTLFKAWRQVRFAQRVKHARAKFPQALDLENVPIAKTTSFASLYSSHSQPTTPRVSTRQLSTPSVSSQVQVSHQKRRLSNSSDEFSQNLVKRPKIYTGLSSNQTLQIPSSPIAPAIGIKSTFIASSGSKPKAPTSLKKKRTKGF